jgi:hypothetical protein
MCPAAINALFGAANHNLRPVEHEYVEACQRNVAPS